MYTTVDAVDMCFRCFCLQQRDVVISSCSSVIRVGVFKIQCIYIGVAMIFFIGYAVSCQVQGYSKCLKMLVQLLCVVCVE